MMQIKVSKLDPDVTVESLENSVLDLFRIFNEPLKSAIYTEVQKVVFQEIRCSNESADYIDIKGSHISILYESIGKRLVNVDPLGQRVQSGIIQWLSTDKSK